MNLTGIKSIFLSALLFFPAVSFRSQNAVNIDFEKGNTGGWKCLSGGYGQGIPPAFEMFFPDTGCLNADGNNAPATALNRHTIMTPAGGWDLNSINPLVPVTAPASMVPSGVNNFSFRIGNEKAGGYSYQGKMYSQSEAIRFGFTVTPAQSVITVLYSVFLQDANHFKESQPRFEIMVKGPSGEIISCGYHKVVASQAGNGLYPGLNQFVYTGWTKKIFNVSEYAGALVTIEFRTSDCYPLTGACDSCYAPGAHNAYAYIDASLSPVEEQSLICYEDSTATLCAPEGFSAYKWTGPNLPANDSLRCITISNPLTMPGIYHVNVPSTSEGCGWSIPFTIKRFDVSVRDTVLCLSKPDSIQIRANPVISGNYLYSWGSVPPGFSSSQQNPKVRPSLTTIYTVTVTNTSLNCSVVKSLTVKTDCSPFVILKGGNLCEGDCIELTTEAGSGKPPYSYTWIPPISSGSGPVTVCPTVNTTYTVTITDADGSTISDTAVVTINSKPLVNAGNDVGFCRGKNVTLSATGNGSVSYYWYPYNALSCMSCPVTVASPSLSTLYQVTGTSLQGCSNKDTVRVYVFPPPVITVTPKLICVGDSVELKAFGGTSYSWSPSAGLNTVNGNVVIAKPTGVLTYTVIGVSATGCTNYATVKVDNCQGIIDESTLEILEVFPNPTNGKLNIAFVSHVSNQYRIVLKNLQGQILLSETISSYPGKNTVIIDTQGFKNGIYLLRIISPKESYSVKVVLSE